jgi:hypothetical protein
VKFKVGDIIIPLGTTSGVYFGRITKISVSKDEIDWTDQDGNRWFNSIYVIEDNFRPLTPLEKIL